MLSSLCNTFGVFVCRPAVFSLEHFWCFTILKVIDFPRHKKCSRKNEILCVILYVVPYFASFTFHVISRKFCLLFWPFLKSYLCRPAAAIPAPALPPAWTQRVPSSAESTLASERYTCALGWVDLDFFLGFYCRLFRFP